MVKNSTLMWKDLNMVCFLHTVKNLYPFVERTQHQIQYQKYHQHHNLNASFAFYIIWSKNFYPYVERTQHKIQYYKKHQHHTLHASFMSSLFFILFFFYIESKIANLMWKELNIKYSIKNNISVIIFVAGFTFLHSVVEIFYAKVAQTNNSGNNFQVSL